jgi:DNA-binding IclR family transcriptional regulator
MGEPRASGVAAVERALAILAAYREGDAALGLADLAQRTGLYKSTILRLIASLERFRFIARLDDGRYQLGPALLHLGSLYQRSLRLEQHVLPALRRLAVWRC